jgi:lysophospholipase L1-like esterase
MTPIRYVALGDSTGAGVGARNGGYVVRLFDEIRKQRPDSTLTNLCISGATSADLIRDQLSRAIKADPELVTVGIGINDIGHNFPLEQFAANFDLILQSLKKETKAVIVVSNIPDVSSSPRVPQFMRPESQRTIERYNNRLAQIASANGVVVFDVYAITHEELPKHPEYFSSDGFHPSDAGYEIWANQMWPVVQQSLGQVGTSSR